jgi:hypothetical protein
MPQGKGKAIESNFAHYYPTEQGELLLALLVSTPHGVQAWGCVQ